MSIFHHAYLQKQKGFSGGSTYNELTNFVIKVIDIRSDNYKYIHQWLVSSTCWITEIGSLVTIWIHVPLSLPIQTCTSGLPVHKLRSLRSSGHIIQSSFHNTGRSLIAIITVMKEILLPESWKEVSSWTEVPLYFNFAQFLLEKYIRATSLHHKLGPVTNLPFGFLAWYNYAN